MKEKNRIETIRYVTEKIFLAKSKTDKVESDISTLTLKNLITINRTEKAIKNLLLFTIKSSTFFIVLILLKNIIWILS